MDPDTRYQKQMLFASIGKLGQQLLADSSVLLVGCGALGCVLADSLTRAGVGRLRIVDRDFVEVSNLQRQVLFTESDVEAHLPKAVAARTRLQQINSSIQIEAIVADVTEANILNLVKGVDLILDGTDNFEIRYLINDVALETSTPWVFTGCTGSVGQMMPIIPTKTGCLRCLMPDAPPTGSTETCDTAGVLGPAVVAIASLQAAMAIRILVERSRYDSEPELVRSIQHLTMLDAWDQSSRQMDVTSLPDGSCPACCNGERRWLRGQQSGQSTILCGRNAVQVTPPSPMDVPLADIAERFRPFADVMASPFLVRATMRDEDVQITVFPDGRAIIKGTEDPSRARSLFARWIGS